MSSDLGSFPEPPPAARSEEPGSGAAAFWADVVRPALNALAPADRHRAVGRVRNAAGVLAALTLLLPAYAPLGTGTIDRSHVVAGSFVLLAAVAHWARKRPHGPWIAAGGAVVVGGVIDWAGSGAASWGWGFAGLVVVSIVVSRARLRFLRLPPRPVEHDPHPPDRSGPPRFLHFLGHTIAIVLILRVFAVQTMNVPTGSMQPTIMGNRPENGASGDWLLVDNSAYVARDPRRWEIVAFLYPLDARVNFVKRLLGLPGETVEFRSGDLYVNGEIARKPPLVQESLWKEIWPRPGPFAKPKPVTSGWSASEDDGWRKDGQDGLAVAPREERKSLARFVKRLRKDESDLRLSVRVEAEAPCQVYVEVESRGRVAAMNVVVRPTDPSVRELDKRPQEILRVGGPGGPTASLDLPQTRVERVALAIVDARAIAYVDGHPVATIDLPPGAGRRTAVRFGADGPVRFSDIRVEKDIHYSAPKSKYVIGKDAFFVVGDNLRFSVDSRKWAVTEFHVKGRSTPLLGAEQTVDDLGRSVPNIDREDGRYRFVDVDGVERDLAKSDVSRVVRGVPLPFVPRENLIGRPMMIVWPWHVSEAGFRPRILP